MNDGQKVNLANDYVANRGQTYGEVQIGSLEPKEPKQLSASLDGPPTPIGRQYAQHDMKR